MIIFIPKVAQVQLTEEGTNVDTFRIGPIHSF